MEDIIPGVVVMIEDIKTPTIKMTWMNRHDQYESN
jgi:hypothetical protein